MNFRRDAYRRFYPQPAQIPVSSLRRVYACRIRLSGKLRGMRAREPNARVRDLLYARRCRSALPPHGDAWRRSQILLSSKIVVLGTFLDGGHGASPQG